jgi:hypothetical protein
MIAAPLISVEAQAYLCSHGRFAFFFRPCGPVSAQTDGKKHGIGGAAFFLPPAGNAFLWHLRA